MTQHVVGIDLGGTNLRLGVIDSDAQILARTDMPTNNEDGYEGVLERMAEGVRGVLKQVGLDAGDIVGIGVGAPGPLNSETGVVLEAPNLKWENVPVAALLKEKTGIPVQLENDANCAGWGEYWAGAGRGSRNMLMMTLGTGVGGAIIVDGKLQRGPDFTAGEIGHIVVVDGGRRCGCGNEGCLEAYASATATVARFREAMDLGWQTSLKAKKVDEITCADIFKEAFAGDNLARHIVEETGRYLGLMAGNMANLLNPDRCIFSGGMIQSGEILFEPIRRECKRIAFRAPGERIKILPAELVHDAGLIGAAGLALVAHGESPA